MNARAHAAKVLVGVIAQKQQLNHLIADYKKNNPHPNPLVQALCYGAMRWYEQLNFIEQQLIKKPLKRTEAIVHCLIIIGLYQLIYLRIPDHAAIYETVSATQQLGKGWSSKLVNAILRNYLRQKDYISRKIKHNIHALYSHPAWLITSIQAEWPIQWQDIIAANNRQAPQTIRVNRQKISRKGYLALLANNNIDAHLLTGTTSGIVILEAQKTKNLPKFKEGFISIQDGAAQLASELLDLQPNERVLDACAAPGGKTAHLIEIEPTISLLALDISSQRCQKIKENMTRLAFKNARVSIATEDATMPETWWDGTTFDKILLDAPCSASGVIRRQPDIKFLKSEVTTDNEHIQKNLLAALWPLLSPGGKLVYTTCSVFCRENVLRMQSFTKENSDARILPVDISLGLDQLIGKQILPGTNNMDGFYFAIFQKK